MRRLLVVCSILQTISCSCPSWSTLVAGGQCRQNTPKLIHTNMSDAINEVVSYCSKSYPVSIYNEEQQSYWRSRVTNDSTLLVLGLTCNRRSGSWDWTDDSIVDYKPPAGYDEELDRTCQTGCSWSLASDGSWRIGCGDIEASYNMFCITQLDPPPIPSTDCGNFGSDDVNDTICYEIPPVVTFTFDAAQEVCHSFGAELASIHSEQENSFIRRMALSLKFPPSLFLGAQSSSWKETDWRWVDGTAWDYDNTAGNSNDKNGGCLIMNPVTAGGWWYNEGCGFLAGAICARPYYNNYNPGCLAGGGVD